MGGIVSTVYRIGLCRLINHPFIILPRKSLVPGSEVAIEEVAEHFEGLQEGFEVGGWLLVLDAKVDGLLQSLRNKDMKTVFCH